MRHRSSRRRFKLPEAQWLRISLGIALVGGGILGFLPVVGFWMLPLGLLVLSVDVPWVRRRRRALAVWWGRRRQARPRQARPRQARPRQAGRRQAGRRPENTAAND